MSFFDKILATLGMGGTATAAPTVGPHPAPPDTVSAEPAATAPAAPAQPVAMVDVAAQWEQRAAGHSQKLNWRTSIVDLLKLLDIDSSLPARKALATELGCPAELMGNSAEMNVWLHKQVLARIAANGGKVPASLLD